MSSNDPGIPSRRFQFHHCGVGDPSLTGAMGPGTDATSTPVPGSATANLLQLRTYPMPGNLFGSLSELSQSHSSGMFLPPVVVDAPTAVTTGNISFSSTTVAPSMLAPSRAQTLYGDSFSSSFPSSQASSTGGNRSNDVGDDNPGTAGSTGTGTGRARKSNLAPADKANVNRASDLLVIEIIDRIGWESETDFVQSAEDCLVQACFESGNHTAFDQGKIQIFTDHKVGLRSKMVSTAIPFAKDYNVTLAADPNGILSPAMRIVAAKTLCERMLLAKNWKIYFLHLNTGDTVELFANPIFHAYHLKFWYKLKKSPIQRIHRWTTTPLRLLATSATALACALRRVALGQEDSQSSTRTLANPKFLLPEYTDMEREITSGMEQALNHVDPAVRHSFTTLLFMLHQEGLDFAEPSSKKAVRSGPRFFMPSGHQLRAPRLYPDSGSQEEQAPSFPVASGSGSQSQACWGDSNNGGVATQNPQWTVAEPSHV